MTVRAYENKWARRRFWIQLTLVASGVGVGAILIKGDPNPLYQNGLIVLAGVYTSTLFGYLGWATYDDKSLVDRLGKDAFAPPSQATSPASVAAPPEGYAE